MMPGVTVEVEDMDNVNRYPCCNLRANAAGDGLTGTGMAEPAGKVLSSRVLLTLDDDVVIGCNSLGRLVVESVGGGNVAVHGSIDDVVTSAVATGHGRGIVMTASGRFYTVEAHGSVVAITPGTLQTGLTLKSSTAGVYSVPVEAMQFSGDYTTRNVEIGGGDLRNLTGVIGSAYRLAGSRALSAGVLPGIALGRCRVVGHDGTTLLLTPPTLLCSGEGGSDSPVYTTDVEQTGTSFQYVHPGELSVAGIGVKLSVPAGLSIDELGVIDHVEVLMTPPLTAVNMGGSSEGVLSGFSGTNCRLRVSMPGQTLNGAIESTRARIIAALSRLSRLERCVARVSGESLLAGDVQIRPVYGMSFEKCIERVDKVLSEDVKAVSRLAGSRWSAGSMTRLGDMIVSGDITRRAVEGFTPVQLSCETSGAGSWRGYCLTEVSEDGGVNRVVADMVGTKGRPESVGPLVVYPGGGGRRITIRVSGSLGRVELPLEPTSDGSFSYYLSADLGAIKGEADTTPFVVPIVDVVESRSRGCVLLTSQENPYEVVAETEVDGAVTALAEAVNGGSTLDFGRLRCYLMSTSGIYSVAVNSSRDRMKCERIDSRGVDSPGCISVADSSLHLLAGSDLVSVSGVRVKDVVKGVGGIIVGHSRRYGETWIVDGEGVLVVSAGGYYRRDDVRPVMFVGFAGRTLAVDASGMAYDIDNESATPSGPVHWSIVLKPKEVDGLRPLMLKMTGLTGQKRVRVWENGLLRDSYIVKGR